MPGSLLLALTLSACNTAPVAQAPQEPDCRPATQVAPLLLSPSPPASRSVTLTGPSLAMQGQMSLKLEAFGDQAAKGISLGFFFNGRAQSGELELMTPMGSQVAQLRWTPQDAVLTDSQGPHRYASLADLSEAALGEALPLDTLIHWMQGHADPALPVQAGAEPDTFEQLGWLIDTRHLDEKKISATRAPSAELRGARIKVYLDR